MARCPNGTRKNKKNGLCEKKESTPKKTTAKMARCPNGTRKNKKTGLCEKKESTPKKTTAKKVTPKKLVKKPRVVKNPKVVSEKKPVNYKFRMFENNVEVSFDNFSGQELSSITDKLLIMLNIDDDQIVFSGENEEKIIVKNVEYNKIKNYVNKKTTVKLEQYGVYPWGKVEFLFEEE